MNTKDDVNKINEDKRPIKSFEAEKDVADMLTKAQAHGLKLGEICNRALRKHGVEIIREILAEHSQRHKQWETLNREQANAKAGEGSSRAARLVRESGKKQTAESPSESKPSRASSGHGNRH